MELLLAAEFVFARFSLSVFSASFRLLRLTGSFSGLATALVLLLGLVLRLVLRPLRGGFGFRLAFASAVVRVLRCGLLRALGIVPPASAGGFPMFETFRFLRAASTTSVTFVSAPVLDSMPRRWFWHPPPASCHEQYLRLSSLCPCGSGDHPPVNCNCWLVRVVHGLVQQRGRCRYF